MLPPFPGLDADGSTGARLVTASVVPIQWNLSLRGPFLLGLYPEPELDLEL
jgi:hypothetical protein